MMRSARRLDHNQTSLTWDQERNERKALVRAVHFSRTGLTETAWANCQEVVTYMIHCETDRGIFPSTKRMAEKHDMSERTVGRAIADLKRLGLLSQKRRGRTATRYWIHYDRIATLGVDNDAKRVTSTSP